DRAAKILGYGADLVRANAEHLGIVHGDWHPGNLIFQGDDVVAVCDFDNTRVGSRSREIAQALVHFSIRQGANIEPDLDLLGAFFDGYQSRKNNSVKPRVIASMMPAVLLDEALASVPAGNLGRHSQMLSALLARVVWMQDHHDELTKALGG
ncbi:MAG: phosphotransferase, partial [Phycisphaerales bacterium]|nr:phosphotransferase [Phycisphaerales bacterium]